MSQNILKDILELLEGPSSDSFKDLDAQLLYIKGAILQNLQNQDYQELEKQVQKYESEIRKHIRTEQQIKLYCEQLQQQLEQFHQNTVNQNLIHVQLQFIYQQLKKEIATLQEQKKHLMEENTFLKKKIQETNETQTQTISSKQPLKLVDFIRKQKLPFDKESYLSNTIDTCSILKKEQIRLNSKTISQQITEQNYDHSRQFINNFNIICNKQKITYNANRQKKSISEHKQIKPKLDLSSIN
ncbi:unnamed protein product (macronuclear) [Paramecium tetraurelia]|uniref:Uncharacterized protein n=1 Tax=Paramecium tetraurelia TaxID=5888 RepID=A0D122_PARTE|nr:uncharacterized protein GSPATT00039154001 [Paramecium tetraurelia]CAK76739.1 unnamed protein product [Paramecium tetraurelia]|eukprot:XP_001444136.1 hypothetical protein (macronuclear) [Paramecium tetraurelia strain d4-2]